MKWSMGCFCEYNSVVEMLTWSGRQSSKGRQKGTGLSLNVEAVKVVAVKHHQSGVDLKILTIPSKSK